MSYQIAVIGHSFINRLESAAHLEWDNLKIDYNKVVINFFGRSGGTLRHFRTAEFMQDIKHRHIKYVLCQIGENDLDDIKSEDDIVAGLLSYAKFLYHGYDLERIVFMQLLCRGKTRHIPVAQFNEKVISVNKKLKQAACEFPWLGYWKHKGLKQCIVTPYCRDELHLNEFGMQRYIRSVRGAVLSVLKNISNPIDIE